MYLAAETFQVSIRSIGEEPGDSVDDIERHQNSYQGSQCKACIPRPILLEALFHAPPFMINDAFYCALRRLLSHLMAENRKCSTIVPAPLGIEPDTLRYL